MNHPKLVILCLFLVISALWGAAIPRDERERELYSPRRVMVKLRPETITRANLPQDLITPVSFFGIEELDRMLMRGGGSKVLRAHRRVKDSHWEQRTGFDRWFIVEFSDRIDIPQTVIDFKNLPAVEDACPDYLVHTQFIPNDTYYPNNWGHNNTAQLPRYQGGSHSGPGVGTPGFDARMQTAWDGTQGMGSTSIIIAIIDSGVDTGHPDLRLVAGWDYGDNDNNPMDNSAAPGHGTGCAGIAAAIGNNSLGVVGSAGGCSVMPLKIAAADGSMSFASMINAITHAADNGAHIASLSLGATVSPGYNPACDAAFTYAYNNGVTIFAATANHNRSYMDYPANHPHVISVGAASPTGERKSTTSSDGENWWGSNYGVNTQDASDAVDIMGPTILPTTDITGTAGYSSNDYYMWFNGTSCATPYVAGGAALVLSRYPTLTNVQLRAKLVNNATDMTIDGGIGWDRFTGYGLVNAEAAVLEPPEITWNPASYVVEMSPDDFTARQLTIGNTGERSLSYSASLPTGSSLILEESFESASIPTGWTQEFVGSSNTSWTYVTGGHNGNPASAYHGTRNARLYRASTTAHVTRLVTPVLDLSGLLTAELRFWHAQVLWSPDQDELRIYYKTSAGGTWTLLQEYTANVSSWTQRNITLPNLSSTYYIAFQGTAKYGYGVCVDLVTVTGTIPPPAPWLDLDGSFVVSGSIANSDPDEVITLNFDSTGLEDGEYNVNISLISNCPTNPSVIIPVTLIVDSTPPAQAIPFVYGFEDGLEDWILVNDAQTNRWHLGTAAVQTGAQAVYISNDNGATNSYSITSSSTAHFYRDIDFPPGVEDMWLKFDWRANGQSTFDYLRTYLIETTSTPVAGVLLSSSYQIGDVYVLGGANWQRASIALSNSLAGQSKRLVFTWRNNNLSGTQPPAAVDNIRIVIGDDTDAAIVIDGSAEIIPPPVSVPDAPALNPSVQVSDLPPATSGIITVTATYAPAFAPWEESGLALTLSGTSFAGATLNIYHGLGFVPQQIGFRISPNAWQLFNDPMDGSWTSTNFIYTVPAGKADGDVDIVFPDAEDHVLPVTMSSFTAGLSTQNNIQLQWITQSESDLVGFYVLRHAREDLADAMVIGDMVRATNTSQQQSYIFTDREAQPGLYFYWLQVSEMDGNNAYFGPVTIVLPYDTDPNAPPIPMETALLDAYPNPFNPVTTIPYSIKEAGLVRLDIYNLKGQLVHSFSHQHNSAGFYRHQWDGKDSNGIDCGSGIYLYRMQAGKYTAIKRMALIK